ncbi:hypothetical protein [Chryseobacterium sp. CT-SW4]|uniref:hypothetical protein n=1 Tax=Chryseobacterium sp. SW-1 TaxID=3157343 RepID=UPI003B0196DA
MSFFKYHNYNTPRAQVYFSHKGEGTDHVFQVGELLGAGLITVLDQNGILQWNKTYSYQGIGIVFKKIISFDGDYIILGHLLTKAPVLLRISANGSVVWCKTFPDINTEENKIFLDSYLNENLFLGYFDSNTQTSGVLSLNKNGIALKKRGIVNNTNSILEINGLLVHNSEVYICGNESANGETIGTYLKTELTLDTITSKQTTLFDGSTYLPLDGIYSRNNNVYLSGTWNNKPIVIIEGDQMGISYDSYIGLKTRFIFGPDAFYIYNQNKEITKSDYSFAHEWTKKMDVMSFAIDQVMDNHLVITGYDQYNVFYSGYIENSIDNCKSLPTTKIESNFFEYLATNSNHNFEDLNYTKPVLDLTVEDVFYNNENVCNSGGISIDFNDNSGLQTPGFYLQAAGSSGIDSPRGVYLRWNFGGQLGENHLPKGNLANNTVNYNKPEDFVKIYRTPYIKSVFKLDFSIPPQLIDDTQKLWVYKFNNNTRIIYVYFRNKEVYSQVRQNINPLVEPLKFVESYGSSLIEVHCKTDLLFAAHINLTYNGDDPYLELECLSVSENNNTINQQYLTYRKRYDQNDIKDNYFNAENGKTIRFRTENCWASSVNIEFYSDFISSRNQDQAWELIGNFGLTDNSAEAFERLDPIPGSNPVNGSWLRYNDNAYVNTDNYKAKWEHQPQGPLDRDIVTVIRRYIELSDQQPNPKANETIDFNFSPEDTGSYVTLSTDPPEPGATEISNLEILNIAALDYHIARMLGLGYLDIGRDTMHDEFIYIAEYYTNKNLDIALHEKTFQLLSMSLPVSSQIERLSLPVDLLSLEKGIGGSNSTNLYNNEGYSQDGKYRYISIYNHQIPEYEVNPTFFSSAYPFDASSFTSPVYAGLEYRLIEPGQTDDFVWKKPELSHDTQYLNIDSSPDSYETLPIQIPDTYAPLYMHKQEKSGKYFYKGYGINWFSRAQLGQTELSVETEIKPYNKLLPPSGVTAFNIQKEYPLTFTSQNEQNRIQNITDDDKTLVRLTFDYHIYQDEIGYIIPFDSPVQDQEYLDDPDSLFPDSKEVFADEVEIYFRDYPPRVISAKAFQVIPHDTNQLLAIIKTKDYNVPSSGATVASPQPSISQTTFTSEIPVGSTISDFIGGIFLLDSDSYIIHEIIQDIDGLTFTVFKKAASEAILAGITNPVIDQSNLSLPSLNIFNEGLFSATENLQNTPAWGSSNPNSLKVKIGTTDWNVHREIINIPQSSGSPQRYLEKSRGFWKKAIVNKHFETITQYQNSQDNIITFPADYPKVHQGIYKITFPGFQLNNHSQYYADSHSVDWFNGIVRLFTNESYNNGSFIDSRSIFKIIRTENIGENNDLIIYFYDENFKIKEDDQYNPIFHEDGQAFPATATDPVIGNDIWVNYYPSYKIHLYKNVANNLIEDAILPSADEDVRYSIFGFRSVDNDNQDIQGNKYKSKFSIPALMFAHRVVEPKQPKQPIGSKYATRPDQFGKATYSFITEYSHKPYSVQFFRAHNALLLAALYEHETIELIKAKLKELGGDEEVFFNNRWKNFVDFDMLTNISSTTYEIFPDTGDIQYRLPQPDNKELFKAINDFIKNHNLHYGLIPGEAIIDESDRGKIDFNKELIKEIPNVSGSLRFGHFIKERISNCFLPLTEVPVIYQHIKKLDLTHQDGHRPANRKQNIRDVSGYLLSSDHADFDMAPMAAVYSESPNHSTLFTDFTLDGGSDNFYFYGVRELGNQMRMGEFSTFLGPIRLVNTNPAEAPKILSLLPVVENITLGINAGVRIEVNPYPEVQHINKILIYRAANKLDAESILSMKHIKTFNIADIEIDSLNHTWVIEDDLQDLENKPYGDLLFYRIVVSRKVEYSITDYNVSPPVSQVIVEEAPSQASKIVVTTLVETYNPSTPVLSYYSEPIVSDVLNWVIISWEQVCYKGKYHLYKLSDQGNWKEIARINTDNKDISKAGLYLFENDPLTNTEDWTLKGTLDLAGNEFFLPLEKLNMDPLSITDSEGNIRYHHFKVVAENTSNMFSTEERILTLYRENTWTDIGGISSNGLDGMILQGTFIVRPN